MVVIVKQYNVNRHYHDIAKKYTLKYTLNVHFIAAFPECEIFYTIEIVPIYNSWKYVLERGI